MNAVINQTNMTPLTQIIREEEKKFDKQFGYSVPDKNGYLESEGRWAGCDNCYDNQELRIEHKEFLLSSQKKLIEGVIGLLKSKKVEEPKTWEGFNEGYKLGNNDALDNAVSLLSQTIKELNEK